MSETFDLRIKFTGLCLLVTDERDEKNPRLHVLLPNVEGHDHSGGHPQAEPHAPEGGHAGHPHPATDARPGLPARPPEDTVQAEGGDHSSHPGHTDPLREPDQPDTSHTEYPDATDHADHPDHTHGDADTPPPAVEPPGGPGDDGQPQIVEHLCRLIFDTAYEIPGTTEYTRELACRDIHGRILEFSGLGDDPLVPRLPREVADLAPIITEKGLLLTFLDDANPGTDLATRVTVDRGCVSDYLPGVIARLQDGEPGEPRLTAQVEWTIRGIPGNSLEISLTEGLNGKKPSEKEEERKITLHPIGRTIILEVWNAPKDELPGSPERKSSSTDHFASLYTLLVQPDRVNAPENLVPIPSDLQLPVKSECFSETERTSHGGGVAPNTLMCMPGQTRVP